MKALTVSEALAQRRSTRAFLDQPVEENLLREVLTQAQRAPSGGNLQPWKIIAVSGDEKDRLIALAKTALEASPLSEPTDRPVYPPKLWEPYRSRRFEAGETMYREIDIPREDKAARIAHVMRNFEFFGAPCALFFIIEEEMGHGQWAHMGMFMQSIALLLEERGLASCFQEAWAMLRPSLHKHFILDDKDMVYCGMAIGYADADAPINRTRTTRATLDDIAKFKGFSRNVCINAGHARFTTTHKTGGNVINDTLRVSNATKRIVVAKIDLLL